MPSTPGRLLPGSQSWSLPQLCLLTLLFSENPTRVGWLLLEAMMSCWQFSDTVFQVPPLHSPPPPIPCTLGPARPAAALLPAHWLRTESHSAGAALLFCSDGPHRHLYPEDGPHRHLYLEAFPTFLQGVRAWLLGLLSVLLSGRFETLTTWKSQLPAALSAPAWCLSFSQ